jgi:hypothetical protein
MLDSAGVIRRTLNPFGFFEAAEADSPQSTGGHGEAVGFDWIAIAAMDESLNVSLSGGAVEKGDCLSVEGSNPTFSDRPMFDSDAHMLTFFLQDCCIKIVGQG